MSELGPAAADGDGAAAAAAPAAGGAAGGGAPLGFSLAGKAKRAKVAVQVQERAEERVLITGIEGSRIRTAAPAAQAAGPRVIPAVANTYRAGVGRGGGAGGDGAGGGFVPSFVPPSSEDALKASNEDKFVAAPADDGTRPAVTKYGLQRMGGAAAAAAAAAQQQQQQQQQEGRQGTDQPGASAGEATTSDAQAALPPPPPRPAGFALPARAGAGRGDSKAALMEELEALPEAADVEVRFEKGGWKGGG